MDLDALMRQQEKRDASLESVPKKALIRLLRDAARDYPEFTVRIDAAARAADPTALEAFLIGHIDALPRPDGWPPDDEGEAYTKKYLYPIVEAVHEDLFRRQVSMPIGDTLWCKYSTDVQGELDGDPEMIVSADDQNGTHYQPEDPEESGVEGDYAVKILKLENDGGSPRVVVYQQSDIEHWAQLWTGRNLGSGSRVYKVHVDNENIFKFRSLLGVDGIKSEEIGDEIHIGGDGGDLNLEIYLLQYDNDGHIYGSPSLETTLYWRKGIYMGDSDPDDGDPPAGLKTYEVHRMVNAA